MKRLLALLASLAVAAALAIEPPKPAGPAASTQAEPPAQKPAPTETPEAEEPAPAEDEPAAARPGEGATKPAEGTETDDEEELPPLPPGTVPEGPPPQRFTPSEKVRADFPVSFPIDI